MANKLTFSFAQNGALRPDNAHKIRNLMATREWEYAPRGNDQIMSDFALQILPFNHEMPVAMRVNLHDFVLTRSRKRLFRRNAAYALTLNKGLWAFENDHPEYKNLRNIYQRHAAPEMDLFDFKDDRLPYPLGTSFYHLDARDAQGDLMATHVFAMHWRSAFGLTHHYAPQGQKTSLGRYVILAGMQMLKAADICDYFYLGEYSPTNKMLRWKSDITPAELAHIDILGNVEWLPFKREGFARSSPSPFIWHV